MRNSINSIDMPNFDEGQLKDFQDQLSALFEKVNYGSIKLDVDVHNKMPVAIGATGEKSMRFHNDNLKAVQEIGKRIKQATDLNNDSELIFKVKIRKGNIEQVLWWSYMKKVFDKNT